jgi:hypothetical protein
MPWEIGYAHHQLRPFCPLCPSKQIPRSGQMVGE